MKKLFLLLGCLVLNSACQSVSATAQAEPAPTSVFTPQPTATIPSTSTSTPAPTSTSTPAPLFFTDDFNADNGAWTSFQTGGAELPLARFDGGLLKISFSTAHTWYYAIRNPREYADVFVRAKFSGAPAGSLGVLCRYDESKGWYEFNAASDGSYSVLFGQWLGEGIAQYTPIALDKSPYLKAGVLDYEIGLLCKGDTLALHINGKL
ncbi:MAG: hypothetical protein LDL51_14135, partial [Chloroflexi bacterium]|nr:hypothetical protein [Chloroflexota bacterium]